jgi:hypothetical protein
MAGLRRETAGALVTLLYQTSLLVMEACLHSCWRIADQAVGGYLRSLHVKYLGRGALSAPAKLKAEILILRH